MCPYTLIELWIFITMGSEKNLLPNFLLKRCYNYFCDIVLNRINL